MCNRRGDCFGLLPTICAATHRRFPASAEHRRVRQQPRRGAYQPLSNGRLPATRSTATPLEDWLQELSEPGDAADILRRAPPLAVDERRVVGHRPRHRRPIPGRCRASSRRRSRKRGGTVQRRARCAPSDGHQRLCARSGRRSRAPGHAMMTRPCRTASNYPRAAVDGADPSLSPAECLPIATTRTDATGRAGPIGQRPPHPLVSGASSSRCAQLLRG